MEVNIGDSVHRRGRIYTIEKILSQSYWEGYGWDLEFVDTNSCYHHWKQYDDGGDLIRKGESNDVK